jgi:peptidoglycan/xylan/chitin deacetylase (PgdA/CDA1 family)
VRRLVCGLALLPTALLGACAVTPDIDVAKLPPIRQPIRYLLTFDDGPSNAAPADNPTLKILATLRDNAVQPDIKAVFFVQTRAPSRGGSAFGRKIMQLEVADGHELGLHTAVPEGQLNHVYLLRVGRLDGALKQGIADIDTDTGEIPTLVRPPYWYYNANTVKDYHTNGLAMLLADIKAHDGKIHGFIASPRRRENIVAALERLRPRLVEGDMPTVGGVIPVVVGFHDTNTYTAEHLQDYLQILVQAAQELRIPLADPPFYSHMHALQQAALMRTQPGITRLATPGSLASPLP